MHIDEPDTLRNRLGTSCIRGTVGAAGDTAAAPSVPVAPSGGTITGTIKAGTIPLPGVGVTATNTLTGKKYATTTDVNGSFAMAIPRNGRYVVKVELAAFATETKEILINAAGENGGKPTQVADFGLQLASRVQEQEARQAAATTSAGLARGVQALSITGDGFEAADASANPIADNAGAQTPSLGNLGGDAAGADSVTVSGAMGTTNGLAGYNEDDIRQRVQDAVAQAQRQGGAVGDMANQVAGLLGGLMGGGGFGGPGGGGPGAGGGRGGGGGGRGGGFRGFNPTQPHGAIFYQGGNGALNAAPFSVAAALGEPGAQVVKPSSMSNQFGVSFTGSPYIPGLIKPSTKQFIFFNLTGRKNINPQIFNGTVPTLAERSGDFSALGQILYDPKTSLPIPGNNLRNAQTPISPQALALLNFYPAPNVPNAGPLNNYQTVTNAGQNGTTAALRYVRNFGQANNFGRGGGGGGRRQQAANAPKTLRQNINFNGSYSHIASDMRNIFLPLGGKTASTGYGITAGYTIGYGRLTNNASLNWNRSHATTENYFTNGASNPAVDAGVLVGNSTIQSNPFYYGVPSLSFGGLYRLHRADEHLTQRDDQSDNLLQRLRQLQPQAPQHAVRTRLQTRPRRLSRRRTDESSRRGPKYSAWRLQLHWIRHTESSVKLHRLSDRNLPGSSGKRIGLCRLPAGHATTSSSTSRPRKNLPASQRL